MLDLCCWDFSHMSGLGDFYDDVNWILYMHVVWILMWRRSVYFLNICFIRVYYRFNRNKALHWAPPTSEEGQLWRSTTENYPVELQIQPFLCSCEHRWPTLMSVESWLTQGPHAISCTLACSKLFNLRRKTFLPTLEMNSMASTVRLLNLGAT